MLKQISDEDVEKFLVSLARVRKARLTPLHTVEFGTGLRLSWNYYSLEGEIAVEIVDPLAMKPIILTVDFIRSLTTLYAKRSQYSRREIPDFSPAKLFAPNGRDSEVICAEFCRRDGRDLVWITGSDRPSSIYVDPAFLTEAVDRLDA